MRTIGYHIIHHSSKSKVEVEFALIDHKIKVTKTKFIEGNVLSWIHFRMAQVEAAKVLTGYIPDPTLPTG
jgi:hypothetical protein